MFLLQGLFAGLACFCVIGLVRLYRRGMTMQQMGRSFEQTDLFFETAEGIVRRKIINEQDRRILERGGVYDETREIDIRLYMSGTRDDANQNRNISYRICDLIDFARNGASQMETRIVQLSAQHLSEEEIGQKLDAESGRLEIILPVTGQPLSAYAKLSTNPGTALLEYYRLLCETARDLAIRYQRYTEALGDETASSNAPSNVLYYVENTGTKERYTNLGVKSVMAARSVCSDLAGVQLLFAGERRYNIMVVDPDGLENDMAVQYFMQTRFVGSSEKVLIAADLSLSVGDELRSAAGTYEQRRPYLIGGAVMFLVAAAVLIVLLVLTIQSAESYRALRDEPMTSFDRIPTEIAAGLLLILVIGLGTFALYVARRGHLDNFLISRLWLPVIAALEYMICLQGLMSLLGRIREGVLWKNSVCYTVVMSSKAVYQARRSSERLMFLYAAFVILNLAFLLIGGVPGLIMAGVLNLAALLYLMLDAVGNQSVREGLREISTGNLDYRINTEVLTGESREMGEAVNEMGEDLQKAVASMISNERLRSELITNVSHDLKTPLTSIISYVDLLKQEELGSERARGYVDILESKAMRLKQLTEDLIEVSRISSGNVQIHSEPLQLGQFLMQACGEFEDRFEENHIQLRVVLPRERIVIMADGAQLWRVCENLLSNMVKYAKHDTEAVVELKRERQGEEQHIAVVDFRNESAQELTASGEELRERFIRGDSSRQTEGSGLGLSIAGSLTELMDGTFHVETTGNIFCARITFPIQIRP